MDFNFTKEQLMLQNAVREFVKAEAAPYEAKWDEEEHCPAELLPKMGKLGMLGIFVPKEYGGAGLGHIERALIMEEISRYSTGLAMTINSQDLGMAALLDFGSEEQKKRYLPDLCRGIKLTGLGTTESHSGSDVAGQKTAGELEDGNWVVTGHKCLITNSHVADSMIITAKTGTDENGKSRFTAMIIENGTPGFTVGKKERKLGLRTSATGELVMDHAKVPARNVLGEVGQGTPIIMKEIGEIGRAGMTAICIGILRGCLEESVKYANERIVYGKPISKLQAIQFHIAGNRMDYEAARLLLHKAAYLKDAGMSPVAVQFSIAKFFAAEAAARAAKRTIEIMGGYGVINEYPAGKLMRDAIATFSGGGTGEIQQVIIAGDTLKLY